jgi:hypothetical protein
VLEILDNGYDSPTAMWTKLMRYEVVMILQRECDLIQQKWMNYKSNEIRIIENVVFWDTLMNKIQPQFPEIQENLSIDDIYLKNFNKNPYLQPTVRE